MWFSPPSELLPTPSCLLGAHRKARRPPALAGSMEAAFAPPPPPPARPGKRTRAAEAAGLEPFLPPDRALDVLGGTQLRHARCALGGRVFAVPQQPQDFEAELEDAEGELLLVELVAPGGAWLEDPELHGVLVRASPPAWIPIAALRRLVQARVNLFGRPAQQLRKLYQLTRPRCAPEYELALVSLADLPTPQPPSDAAASPPA
jgi:hypothetical protein